jgi:hypothetical protein
MPEDQRELGFEQIAVDDVQVGATDPAGANAKEHLAGAGPRVGDLLQPEGFTLLVKNHRPHA